MSSLIKQKPAKQQEKDDAPLDIKYAVPSKPLDFSFRKIVGLKMLIKTEERSGIRRTWEEIEKEEKLRQESTLKIEKKSNTEEEEEEEKDKKPKKKELDNEEGGEVKEFFINDIKNVELPKGKAQSSVTSNVNILEEKKNLVKRKVKYIQYTNAVILHNNEIYSLADIHTVFNTILIEPEFIEGSFRSKVELIQWLDLSQNNLSDIHEDICNLKFLKILYLHANNIQEIDKIKPLRNCHCLINLTLHGNLIEHIKGYRQFIIELVPTLEKLDFTLISEKELDIIHFKGCRNGEVRDKQGKVSIYPKLDERFIKQFKEKNDDKNNNLD